MSGFTYFGTTGPCPVCGSRKKQCRANNTGLHFCRGAYHDQNGFMHLGSDRYGFQMFRSERELDQPFANAFGVGKRTPEPSDAEKQAEEQARYDRVKARFKDLMEDAGKMPPDLAARFAKDLGLPASSFNILPVLYTYSAYHNREALLFPECKPSGKIINLVARMGKEKRAISEARRGLTIPRDFASRKGPIYIPEGATDVLALCTMGLAAVGRPNSMGGVEMLTEFLRNHPDREIIVLGENDKKDDGRWPGRDGALFVARKLSDALQRPVTAALPSDGRKDARVWFQMCHRAFDNYLDAGACFAKRLVVIETFSPSPKATEAEQASVATGGDRPAAFGEGARLLEDATMLGAHVSEILMWATQIDPFPEDAIIPEGLRVANRDAVRYPCLHTYRLVLEHLDTRDPYVFEVRCLKWTCPGCRRFLTDRELISASAHFHRAGFLWELYCPIYDADGKEDPRAWRRLHRRIRRLGGEYLRIRDGDNWWVVTDVRVPGSVYVEPETAVATLRHLFETDHSCCEERPVATSHGWQLPKDERASQFRRIGKGSPHLSTATLNDIADDADAVLIPRRLHGSGKLFRVWQFVRPGGWNQQLRDKVYSNLFAGEVLEDFNLGPPSQPPPTHQPARSLASNDSLLGDLCVSADDPEAAARSAKVYGKIFENDLPGTG